MEIINTQEISPVVHDSKLLVHSIFRTIQGEAMFAGHPAIFIRLGGCNLQCPQCDTDYTDGVVEMYPDEILEHIQATAEMEKLVVITGGEPFRQSIGELCNVLLGANFQVQIETNGTLYRTDIPYKDVTIVCSPKTGRVNRQLQKHIAAYKYVCDANSLNTDDGLPLRALGHSAHPHLARPHRGFSGRIYVQPLDEQDQEKNERHTRATVESAVDNGYIFCLQVHKYIDMP